MSADTILDARGTSVPKLGFGTWLITGAECEEAVRDALEIGYRHIDTARAYDNEAEVGRALEASDVDREDIFLTTKVWMDDVEPGRLRRSAEDSLRDLRTDYVDLLLIHWPNEKVPIEDSLSAMEELRAAGRVRHYGVSNFTPTLLREALGHGEVLCDQVEFHPFLGQDKLLAVAREAEVVLTAYSPLAHGKAADDATLRDIGEAHGKSASQVALRWVLDHPNTVTVPKASSHERRLENFEVFDFELTDEERARIDVLPKDRRGADPDWAPDWED